MATSDTNAKTHRSQSNIPFLLMAATGLFCIGASTTLFAITSHPDVPVAIRWALGLPAFFLAIAGTSSLAAAILAARGVLSIPGIRRKSTEHRQ